MNEEEKTQSDSTIMSQLTGYLDGELDGDEYQMVEERLAHDPHYRKLMQQLQQSWDLLDVLPASSVNRSFTQSTMKLVVQDAKKSASKNHDSPWTWPIRILALILVPLVSTLLAFQVNRHFQKVPLQQLASDLAIIKDLDVLNCDENLSIDLLQAIAAEDSIFGVTAKPKSDKRKVLFEQSIVDLNSLALLSNEEKKFVLSNNETFSRLPLKRVQAIRKLNNEIDEHPNCDVLKSAMFGYYFWLQNQTEKNSARVLDQKDVQGKLAVIRDIVDTQFLPNFTSELPEEDRETLFLGLIFLARQQRELIDKRFRELFDFVELLKVPEVDPSVPLSETKYTGYKLQRIFNQNPELIDEIVNHDLVQLIKENTLSPIAKEFLELTGYRFDHQISESRLLTIWMLESYKNRFLNVDPTDIQLEALYQNLSAELQEKLDNERPRDRKKQLKRIWLERNGQIQ